MTSPTRTVGRREAAVTAALGGTVLVVLGYASGIGLRPGSAAPATLPQQPAPATELPTPLSPTPSVVPPTAAHGMPAAAPMDHLPPTTPAPTHPSMAPPPGTTPTTPVADPSASPAPHEQPTCSAGLVDPLLDQLPLLATVSSLLEPLSCTLAAVAPGCCPTTARTTPDPR